MKTSHMKEILQFYLVQKSLVKWQPISDRIITAILHIKCRNISFIQCYAPTDPTYMEEIQKVYDQLTPTLQKLKKGNKKGDKNSKA